MTSPDPQPLRVGTLRPNQLLHTYGVGAMADLPNLSVIMQGLDAWKVEKSTEIVEERLLAAVRAKLGNQVAHLRLPPYEQETYDPFGSWAKVGVPVQLFPTWLRCSRCNRLGRANFDYFELVPNSARPDRNKYVHSCKGSGSNRPPALPARFVLACEEGHLDDFPWQYYAHKGDVPESGHSLKMTESGSTGEAANVYVTCDECGKRRPMSQAFGADAPINLPACRGRHPHLGTFSTCGKSTRTLVLGATNSWFPMQLRVFTLPLADDPLEHLVEEFWDLLLLFAGLDEGPAKELLVKQNCWSELEPHGLDNVWRAIRARAARGTASPPTRTGEDLSIPEWEAFTSAKVVTHPDFTTQDEPVPSSARGWLHRVTLVPRLREVAALYGFTRIDAPEWEVRETPDSRRAPLAEGDPTWVPCAELRGEGLFLRFDEAAVAAWERKAETVLRARQRLIPAHDEWCRRRDVDPRGWPGLRYVLLHTFAHLLIRELALDSGYSAAGIAERIYATREGVPMAGVLLYTAAPDSEGTLGGLVSLGRSAHLGHLIDRALESARLCSSDPLCAEHDPVVHGRLYGAACHACLFASETSCERGNQYLDRALLVDTLATRDCGFFSAIPG
ncbi:uncharacterized protein DUF1998 [Herbihabitans rhizosphaerae]|uniref:Uncharacterized protein DUF1998 n=1 Tax=Herbihabitans rhizosphaerae TaxID=1872711 RepID=A0A4Q7KF98_9PSEU|nr:DUF1998 domain-containing protein [Herbihabitans rhizosphaerae]RZS32196.1 uncharacterized protein DUF1998 [Herbihabitans rhizosphaerae]